MKYRGPLSLPLGISTHRTASKRICNAATALAFTLCLLAAAPSAFGQCPQPVAPPVTDPLHTIIPVHFETSTGFITVGSKTYCGSGSGFHLLVLSRQPDKEHLDAPDMLLDETFTNAVSVDNTLKNFSSMPGGPIVMVNAVGDYGVGGITLSAVAQGLKPFGAYPDLKSINAAPPFIFIGNAGRKPQTALQRGYSTLPLDGYLVQDSNLNYTFTQTDFVHYDITTDGTITIGNKPYTVANSYRVNCDGQNAFHLLKVDRARPNAVLVNNSYCTAQSDYEIQRLIADLNVATSNFTDESALYFIASNGHPIPANWSFGTDGDARFYPLAQQVAKLGGYWETMVYLTPTDTYSLVGETRPPAGTPQPRPRAQESSSVYPVDVNGNSPSGELHGVLVRGRGNWYGPLNADPTGTANLHLYDIMAQGPVAFPHPHGSAEITAFQTINQILCKSSSCNVRNQYGDLNIDIAGTYEITLENIKVAPNGEDCTKSQYSAYCLVWEQLHTEFMFVSNIRSFYDNVSGLWSSSATVTLADQLSAYNTVLATMPQAPTDTPSPSLAKPLVDLFLKLGSKIPEVGPVFGVADLFFNFATGLTTGTKGNQTINLTSTIGHLETQAVDQFIAQGNTTGTLFEFIYEDWGKMSTLGTDLASASDASSPWYWGTTTTPAMLQAMGPTVQQAAYQSIMPAAYAIGSYVPQNNWNCGIAPPNPPLWGQTPLWLQTWSYGVLDIGFPCPAGLTSVVQPFNSGWGTNNYIPYTYPTDLINPYHNDSRTGTILADNSWLGISLQTSSISSTDQTTGHYDPPNWSLLSTLFTPAGQDSTDGNPGLGVYRPAFFEGWPFPRVTCDPAYNVPDGKGDGGTYVGGCNWGGGVTTVH